MDANDGEPQPLDPDLDWTASPPLVERVPNRCGGAPVLRGTRLPVKSILDNYDDGCTPDQVAAMFEVAVEDVRAVLESRERNRT